MVPLMCNMVTQSTTIRPSPSTQVFHFFNPLAFSFIVVLVVYLVVLVGVLFTLEDAYS